MSHSSLHALGSADDSGYYTGRPRDNPPRYEPEEDPSEEEPSEEDPSEDPESENEVSSREATRVTTRMTPTPVSPQPPQNGVRSRATARMSVAPPVRFAVRDFPPGTGPSRPSGNVPPETVSGIPISLDPNMTFWLARRVDGITHELQAHRASIAHHGQMLGNTVDLTERLIYRVSDARDTASTAIFWCRVLAGLTFLLAAMLVWVVWFRV